ncbi:MAG: OmpA family protein, partial [Pseudomonadota bacterium]
MLKRSLFTLSPILIGLLAGCAAKQTWVPELERAEQTYAEISADPIVASLAEEDLRSAARQLQRAKDSAASFRKPQTVAHQANIARLQTLTAQQRARTLTATHGVQVALGQDPLLSEEKIAAATAIPMPMIEEPIMAAAIAGGESDIQAQLLALSQQIANLQAQLAGSPQATNPSPYQPMNAQGATASEAMVADEQLLAPLNSLPELPIISPPQPINPEPVTAAVEPLEPIAEEPAMAAAIQAQEINTAATIPGSAQIHRKLRAMNAKPSSRGMALLLGERYFESSSDRLMRTRAARHLDNVASVLKQNPSLELFIEGHTDDQAPAEQSQDLSINRAISIKSAL